MKAWIHTNLILEDGILWDGAILWENDRIVALGSMDDIKIPEETEVLDAQGLYTAPGLIDIHNHGGPDFLFHEDPVHCAEFFLMHGQTTVLPTFYCNLTLQQMLDGLRKIKNAARQGAGRSIGGIYMEGPYMNGTGSNQKYILWDGAIKQEE